VRETGVPKAAFREFWDESVSAQRFGTLAIGASRPSGRHRRACRKRSLSAQARWPL